MFLGLQQGLSFVLILNVLLLVFYSSWSLNETCFFLPVFLTRQAQIRKLGLNVIWFESKHVLFYERHRVGRAQNETAFKNTLSVDFVFVRFLFQASCLF